MKTALVILLLAAIGVQASAQQSEKRMSLAAGREVLNMLPNKMSNKNADKRNDRLMDKRGKQGVSLRRNYGNAKSPISIIMIDNSLSYNTITNAIAKAQQKPSNTYKVVNIKGYNSLLQKVSTEQGQAAYEIVIPVVKTLLLLRAPDYTPDDLIALAKDLPLDRIKKRIE